MRKITKRSAAIIATAVIGVGGLGVAAFASGWLVEGTGVAQAKASEVKPMSATAKFTSNIFPGSVNQATVSIDNPNDFPVAINKVDYKLGKDGKLVVTATKKACENDVKALSEALFTPALPDEPVVVEAKKKNVKQAFSITVGELPESCIGNTLDVDFIFSGNSTTAPATQP